MKTKTIFSIALIALPLTALADPVVSVGPAAVPSNGTAVVATANPPYQTLTPTNDDKSHIASTAYVKGAYNDSIAAVNKVADTVSDLSDTVVSLSDHVHFDVEGEINDLEDTKQDKLYNHLTDEYIGTNVVGSNDEAISAIIQTQGNMDYSMAVQVMLPSLEQELGIDYGDSLITAEAAIKLATISNEYKQQKLNTIVNNTSQEIDTTVAQTINTTTPSATTLVSEAAVASAINSQTTALNNKCVEIYTTWDNDNAKKQVAFVTASQQ